MFHVRNRAIVEKWGIPGRGEEFGTYLVRREACTHRTYKNFAAVCASQRRLCAASIIYISSIYLYAGAIDSSTVFHTSPQEFWNIRTVLVEGTISDENPLSSLDGISNRNFSSSKEYQ